MRYCHGVCSKKRVRLCCLSDTPGQPFFIPGVCIFRDTIVEKGFPAKKVGKELYTMTFDERTVIAALLLETVLLKAAAEANWQKNIYLDYNYLMVSM